MPSLESIRLNFRNKIYIPLTCKYRGKKLNNSDFTIISNNCWGGTIYEAYNISKKSPTVGIFFMAKDYIEFLFDLNGYINSELTFISPKESRWKDAPQVLGDKRFGSYPIGVLSNGKKSIELFFLHYHSEQEAREKWERRIKRINWNRLLIKFNDQNGCTESLLNSFLALPYKNKVFFTCQDWKSKSDIIVKISQPFNKAFIQASYEPFEKNKKFDVTYYLNNLKTEGVYE